MNSISKENKDLIIRQSNGKFSAKNFNDTYRDMFEEGQELLKTHSTTGRPLKIKILKKYPYFALCELLNMQNIKVCFHYRELSQNKVLVYE